MKNKSLSAFNNIPRQAATGDHPYGLDRGMAAFNNIPRQTMIANQPHMLAYINPEEEALIQSQRSGMPAFEGPGGVPAFWTLTEPSTWFDGGGYQGTGNFDASDNSGGGGNDDPPYVAPVITTNNNDSNTVVNNGLNNYTNIYDAINAEGVGATVMINGVTMAAVAADGYIGNGQYENTSSDEISGFEPGDITTTELDANGNPITGYDDLDGALLNLPGIAVDTIEVDPFEEDGTDLSIIPGDDRPDLSFDLSQADEPLVTGAGLPYTGTYEGVTYVDGFPEPIVSTGTGQVYVNAAGDVIEYGIGDDAELTDEEIVMSQPVNVNATDLGVNDFIILTQDGMDGKAITPVGLGETYTSIGGKQVALPEGIGAIVGDKGTKLIDEATGEVVGFLPNKTVQVPGSPMQITIYGASTQALIDNASAILSGQINNGRYFDIAEGIEIADPNRDFTLGLGDKNEGDLGVEFGNYESFQDWLNDNSIQFKMVTVQQFEQMFPNSELFPDKDPTEQLTEEEMRAALYAIGGPDGDGESGDGESGDDTSGGNESVAGGIDDDVNAALTGSEVSTIVTDALALLPASATPTEISTAITKALGDQNNLSPTDVSDAITTALIGQNNLSNQDVQTIIDTTVGSPSTTTPMPDGTEVVTDATGIYAEIQGVGNEIKTAISNLPASPTITEITDAVTTVLSGQNDLDGDEVAEALTKALEGKFNLNADDIGDIVDGIVGSPSTTTTMPDGTEVVTDPTGIYADIKGVGDAISDLNDLSAGDVEGIVGDAIGDLNNLSDKDVGDIITDTVGSPSTTTVMEDGTEVVTDATGIYGQIEGLNNLSTTDVSTAINAAIDGLPDYATPADVTSAITNAVTELTTGALQDMQAQIDEIGRYETSEDFSVREIVEDFKRQRKGGMGYGLPSYMQRYMSGNVIDELVREVVLPDGSKFFVTPDGRYLDPEEFTGSKTTGGVQYVSTGDERYQSGYSTLDTKTGVKTNYDMDGKVIGTSVQPESTLAS